MPQGAAQGRAALVPQGRQTPGLNGGAHGLPPMGVIGAAANGALGNGAGASSAGRDGGAKVYTFPKKPPLPAGIDNELSAGIER
jgi:hypothetical protein